MATSVRFDRVNKSFRVNRAKSLKDLALGITGYRPKGLVIEAVRDLSFEVQEGESVALLGHNGSGKSTTLKMLAGTVAPTTGRIYAAGQIAPLLELGAGFHPDLTGRENIFLNSAMLGIQRREAARRLNEIAEFAEVQDFLDTPLKFYSSGMAVRLGFAIAVNVRPAILLVDEVLAVGDEHFQAKSLNRMRELKNEGRTVILVTHSLVDAQSFCSRSIVLDHGTCTYDGPVEGAGAAYHQSSRISVGESLGAVVSRSDSYRGPTWQMLG